MDDAYAQRVAKGFVKIKYDLDLGKANMEYRMANGMQEMMDAVEKAGGGPADKCMQVLPLLIPGQILRISLTILTIFSIPMRVLQRT